VDLLFAGGDLLGGHEVGLGEKDDDAGEGRELLEVLYVNRAEAWRC
jgi:hypothetical protein